ncbi:hypothetical protein SVAN01_03975 [Stagonosporopsis vannaccii]|nr:hypothetical protein SVAN01_03975 [Stagonosporopsis vannaccii]
MCRYWKKLHTCSHPSDRPYLDMCRSGFLTNTVCRDIDVDEVPRRSHFPCWQCIRDAVRAEAAEKHAQALALAAAAERAREQAVKYRVEVEKRAREERVRREAKDKAERERVVEEMKRVEREKEVERARREGGLWVLAEAGSGKKKKKGPVAAGLVSPTGPLEMDGVKSEGWKENGKGWKEEKGESSGRAGTWGPKKILSRKEGAAGVLGRADVVGEKDGKK